MGHGMKAHIRSRLSSHAQRGEVISDSDPRILNWLKEARAADKQSRAERGEISLCGSSSAMLSEFYEVGSVAIRHPNRRHLEAE
jgi:hypothetical protein